MDKAPNTEFHKSVFKGLLIDNSFLPDVGDYCNVLNLPFEKINVWTHSENEYSILISEVDIKLHEENYWKNFGILFKYAKALTSDFESIIDIEYNWINKFQPTLKPKELSYLELDHRKHDKFYFDFEIRKIYEEGRVLNLSELYDLADIISGLNSDDTFFFAVQHMVSAIESHWFCQVCELSPPHLRKHPSHDFEKHYEIFALPRLEIAIIQSTKAIEGILGQPGKNQKRRIKRFEEMLSLNPNDKFLETDMTYLEFHDYLVSDVRNKVAHNLRNEPFKSSRKLAIKAQLFAWTIVRDYYFKNIEGVSNGTEELKYNNELKSRINPNLGTKWTDKSMLK
jgi:hypothetical protein